MVDAQGLVKGAKSRDTSSSSTSVRERRVLYQFALNLNSELFPEAVAKGTDLLERGVADFSAWSRSMIYCFGEPVCPHLDRIWLNAQDEWQRRQTAEAALHPSCQPEQSSE